MRLWLAAVFTLLAATACSRRDAATATAAQTGPALPPPPSVPQLSRWTLDPENSSAEFVCKHLLTDVRGMLPRPSGSVTIDESNPANSKVSAALDVNLINTGVDERDAHLKSADFFEAAKYPSVTFVSKRVSSAGAGIYEVAGELTMHGVTKPVTLSARVSAPFRHAGGIRRGIEATTTVNRRDFGLTWDFPGEPSGVVVGDDIKITVDAELVLEQ